MLQCDYSNQGTLKKVTNQNVIWEQRIATFFVNRPMTLTETNNSFTTKFENLWTLQVVADLLGNIPLFWLSHIMWWGFAIMWCGSIFGNSSLLRVWNIISQELLIFKKPYWCSWVPRQWRVSSIIWTLVLPLYFLAFSIMKGRVPTWAKKASFCFAHENMGSKVLHNLFFITDVTPFLHFRLVLWH